jgi:DNA-binding GntR family transcriptional regulator
MATTRRRSSAPVYHQIADELRAQISSGELPPGAQLPTELDLASQHGVARQTVRQAVAQLVAEGLVVSQRPRGHFVRERTHYRYSPQREFRPPVSTEMDRFMGQVTLEDGRTPSQTIDVGLVQASPEVAQRLGVEAGEIVVARRRVRSIDGEPFNLNDTFYPLELVQGSAIMSPADVPQGTNQLLAERGFPQDRALDEIYVRMPTPDETRRLELQPGTPVAMHICTGYTAEGQPVRCTVNVLPGDRHVIVYERHRPHGIDVDSDAAQEVG